MERCGFGEPQPRASRGREGPRWEMPKIEEVSCEALRQRDGRERQGV